jgi:hypothetical protein
VRIYEPIGLARDISDERAAMMTTYANALRRWRSKDFIGAREHFEQISDTDPPARFFLERCRQLIDTSTAADWTPVHVLDRK